MTSKYAVVFEKSRTGYGAYVRDLPGCVAAAPTTFAKMVEVTAA